MATRKKESPARETSATGGGLALLAAVLARFDERGQDEELGRAIEAVRQMLLDWQVAYNSLDAQLSLALRANDENGRLIVLLREELRRAQARAAEAEARAFQVEGKNRRADADLVKAGTERASGGSK